MPTPAAPAPCPPSAGLLAMCLLHADYHPMTGDCWTATTDFFFAHAHLPAQEASDWYMTAVEAAMLDQHIRRHLAGPTP